MYQAKGTRLVVNKHTHGCEDAKGDVPLIHALLFGSQSMKAMSLRPNKKTWLKQLLKNAGFLWVPIPFSERFVIRLFSQESPQQSSHFLKNTPAAPKSTLTDQCQSVRRRRLGPSVGPRQWWDVPLELWINDQCPGS